MLDGFDQGHRLDPRHAVVVIGVRAVDQLATRVETPVQHLAAHHLQRQRRGIHADDARDARCGQQPRQQVARTAAQVGDAAHPLGNQQGHDRVQALLVQRAVHRHEGRPQAWCTPE